MNELVIAYVPDFGVNVICKMTRLMERMVTGRMHESFQSDFVYFACNVLRKMG
jgi:hypothetical protein